MKNQNQPRAAGRTLALLAILVVVIAAAAVLYPRLSEQMAQPAIPSQPAQTPEVSAQAEASPDASAPQDAPSATTAPAQQDAPAVTTVPAQTQQAPAEVAGPVQKNMAIDFTMYNSEGNAVRLSDFEGKPVVVNFFASWCGPCKIEMPYFEACYQTYGEQVHFLMVNLNAFGNDTEEAARKMIAEGGYTFPFYFDTDGEAATAYAVRSMPTTLFISADGELLGRKIGTIQQEVLEATVAQMAAGAL